MSESSVDVSVGRGRKRWSLLRIGGRFWSWVWFILGAIYFLVPLFATLRHSLHLERDVLGFKAYERAFEDPSFLDTFLLSNALAVATIVCSILLIVPTAY